MCAPVLTAFRSSPCRRLAPGLSLALAFLATTVSPAGAQSRTVDVAGERAHLLVAPRATSVELPDGSLRTLDVPSTRFASLVVVPRTGAVGWNWFAAGSRELGDGSLVGIVESERAGERSRVRLPRRAPGRMQVGVTLLGDGEQLIGAAWLEGDTREKLAVWYADWKGRRFAAPQQVADQGPGSQLSLSGAVLADGSVLLVWSAFDGQDDEVVARLKAGDSWQPAHRISPDNAVPDITPQVHAVGEGAVVAWSRFDGEEYRLRTAHFDGGRWVSEQWSGPRGSLYPVLQTPQAPSSAAVEIVYMNAWPRSWSLLELDAQQSPLRLATAESQHSATPLVTATSSGATFRWPGTTEPVASAWREP